MHEFKLVDLECGKNGLGETVKSDNHALAIGMREAQQGSDKVPKT